LKAQKAFANIVAPFDGVVTGRNIDVGSLVKADADNGPGLFAVADVHQMRIYVPVPESYAAEMTDGMKATLELPEHPDHKFEAKIETTSHAIDKKSRTLLVELIADNKDGDLFPGAFARVHFQIPSDPNPVRVPASALMYRGNAIQVGVLDPDNRVSLRKVQIARDLGTEVEIKSGLAEDERIVANPPDSIGDGEEVRIMSAEADEPTSTAGRQVTQRERASGPRELAASEQGRGE
jgi:RND family efflux transporter MFP subunit